MCAETSEPAGGTADATGAAAGETGVEGGGGGGVYICNVMCVCEAAGHTIRPTDKQKKSHCCGNTK